MLLLNVSNLQLRDTKARVVICTTDSANTVHQAIPLLDGRFRNKIQLICFGDVDGAKDVITELESIDENKAPEPVSAKDVDESTCLILWDSDNTSEYLTQSQLFLDSDNIYWHANHSNAVFWTWDFDKYISVKEGACTDQKNFKEKIFLPLTALEGGRRYILKKHKRPLTDEEAKEIWNLQIQKYEEKMKRKLGEDFADSLPEPSTSTENGQAKQMVDQIASTSSIQAPYSYKRMPINFTMEDLENSSEEEDNEYEVTASPSMSSRIQPKRNCRAEKLPSSDSDTASDIYGYSDSDIQHQAELTAADTCESSVYQDWDDYEDDSAPRFSF